MGTSRGCPRDSLRAQLHLGVVPVTAWHAAHAVLSVTANCNPMLRLGELGQQVNRGLLTMCPPAPESREWVADMWGGVFVVHQMKTWGHTCVQLAYAVASVSHMLSHSGDTDGRCWYGEAGMGRVG